MKYDVFISYRSMDGAQYARIIQLQLEKAGYHVFLDYDELKRDRFGDEIIRAIQSAPVFLMVLTPLYLERIKDTQSWINKEITTAIQGRKHFVPINPDGKYPGVSEGVPLDIADVIENYQHSIIDFGQSLKVTFDLMVSNQIYPVVKPRRHFWNHWTLGALICSLIIGLGFLFFFKEEDKLAQHQLIRMRMELEKKYTDFQLYLNPDLSISQMKTVDHILNNMVLVKEDSLWMSKFEFTVGQWNEVMCNEYEAKYKSLPMTDISFGEIYLLIDSLQNMTNIPFALPSVEEWQYAARGGNSQETTIYVGSDDVEKVAWYKDNSGGKAHPSDGRQGKGPNSLDLFDMSGNVAEFCNSPFGESGLYAVCGGHYESAASEVTVISCQGVEPSSKNKNIGFRLIIRKE